MSMPSGSGEVTAAAAAAEPVQDAEPVDPTDPVAQAIDGLAALVDRPLDEHPEVYQQVHATLQQALQDIPT